MPSLSSRNQRNVKIAPAAAAHLRMALPPAVTPAHGARDLSAQGAAASWQTGNEN